MIPNNITPEQFNTEEARDKWSSFLFPLTAALDATVGEIAEVGIGFYSTAFLHDYGAKNRRFVLSIEDDPVWSKKFSDMMKSDDHNFMCAGFPEALRVLKQQTWGVIFLDESPGEERADHMVELLDHAEFIVIHDYHEAIEAAIAPKLAGLQFHACKSAFPPTLVVSKVRQIPESVLKL
jgi:hypothetical protein